MIFRTDAQKKDPALSWKRGDRAFFASGACHILCHVFLLEKAGHGYRPYLIHPSAGYRGIHVFAGTETMAFDYHGYSQKARYLEHYFRKMKRFFPCWDATVIELPDFMTPAFLAQYNHRAPDQYFGDPVVRARSFIAKLNSR